MSKTRFARYNIGQVIRHRLYTMRGVIFGTIAAVLAIGLAFAITFVLFKDEEVA